MASNLFLSFLTLSVLYIAYTFPKHDPPQPKSTNFVVYVHDKFTGADASAITVAGKQGKPTSAFNILQFGSVAVVDDPVTEGPTIESKEIGRAQGVYINSQIDGKGLYLVFSVIFTDGEFEGSTLEIQGSDIFSMKEREFGVVSGTGYFRFVKGYGIMETAFMDVANLSAIIKLNVTVKHY
ncbi:Dirigent protein 11 [Linum perenne]